MTTASENPTDKMPDMLCSLSRNWWAFVLRGVLALIIAVLSLPALCPFAPAKWSAPICRASLQSSTATPSRSTAAGSG